MNMWGVSLHCYDFHIGKVTTYPWKNEISTEQEVFFKYFYGGISEMDIKKIKEMQEEKNWGGTYTSKLRN